MEIHFRGIFYTLKSFNSMEQVVAAGLCSESPWVLILALPLVVYVSCELLNLISLTVKWGAII